MSNVSIADAKARLSELVERVEAGDEVCITRRGKPVAKLTAAKGKWQPVDAEALRALTSTMPKQKESAGDFMRRVRDSDRY
jgi:prevent-host-death family protein